MKEIEEVKYRKMNKFISKYRVMEYKSTKFSVDDSEEEIWFEKYRPRIIEDLILPKEQLAKLEDIIESKKLPNLLFYSSIGGSGKDSIISVLKNNLNLNMMIYDASLDRGIDNIKSKVIPFATSRSIDDTRKVVYLTELGGMTKIAVDSLKSFIESQSHVSFLVSTNNLSNLSQPFLSRFNVIEMNGIPKDENKEIIIKVFKRLQCVLEYENVKYTKEDVVQIIRNNFIGNPSYREIFQQLQNSVIGGELVYNNSNTVIELFNEALQCINESKYEDFAKMSQRIDIKLFLNYLGVEYPKILKDFQKDYVEFMNSLHKCQTSLATGVMLKHIPLIVFANECMMHKIKFNLEENVN